MANVDERLRTLERKSNGFAKVLSTFEGRLDAIDNTVNELSALTKEQMSELFSQLKTASDMLESISEEFYVDPEEEEEEEEVEEGDEFQYDDVATEDGNVDEIPELPFPVEDVDDEDTTEEESDDESIIDEV